MERPCWNNPLPKHSASGNEGNIHNAFFHRTHKYGIFPHHNKISSWEGNVACVIEKRQLGQKYLHYLHLYTSNEKWLLLEALIGVATWFKSVFSLKQNSSFFFFFFKTWDGFDSNRFFLLCVFNFLSLFLSGKRQDKKSSPFPNRDQTKIKKITEVPTHPTLIEILFYCGVSFFIFYLRLSPSCSVWYPSNRSKEKPSYWGN